MKRISRRQVVQQLTAGGILLGVNDPSFCAQPMKKSELGIAISSYGIHSRLQRREGFRDPIRFVNFCHERGVAGVQLPLGNRDKEYTHQLRKLIQKHGIFLEGSISTPRTKADVAGFEAEVKSAKESGAVVLRSVMLSGRRYETFKTAKDFLDFRKQSILRLQLAEPIVRKHGMKLAIENHKDFRTDEMLAFLKNVSSEHVGICVDTGNNIALLNDAMEMVKAFAPFAFSCHLKDMGVEPCADGFLLSEVPLGTGLLDLKGMVQVLRKANPQIQFSLEMITRDPLRIPCLTDLYWETMPHVSGRDLARMLRWVRQHKPKNPLPRVNGLSPKKQLEMEEMNVRLSLKHANDSLFHSE